MAEEQNEGQEKTLDASEQKLRKAREKGDIPISTEFNTVLLYIGIGLTIISLGSIVAQGVLVVLLGMFEHPEWTAQGFLGDDKSPIPGFVLRSLGQSLFPFFALPALLVILSLIPQKAIVFSPSKIKPKLSKLSPIANAKKKYGPGGLGEFLKSFAKLCLIAVAASLFLYREFTILPTYSGLHANSLLELLAQKSLLLLLYIIIGTAFIAAIDMPAKWLSHQKKMRMTLQEAKDERKESEGDPYQKQRRRQKAEEIAKTTMLQDVTNASVVIVNPEHYAVALKWDRSSGEAPQCVAKGVDNMAFRIRERAQLAGVAIYENPPTARALYAQTKIGEIIPLEHYAAVAAAIHYADQFENKDR
ncbi:MAG: flagellar type III secretion system protein FlhB [Robiginitomaculum sp.]|nr:flagellar type III secretion system protein FlhB [Robiginitomaculum sp.]